MLQRPFYCRTPEIVAQDLLGKTIHHRTPTGQVVSGIIVETEAYLAANDPAAHNKFGATKARQSLFKEGGHLYLHPMRQYVGMDIVTESAALPSSVLLRALEPIGTQDKVASGPGKLTQFLHITRSLDGLDICHPDSTVWIDDADNIAPQSVLRTARVGISDSQPLRFCLKSSKYLSR